MTQGIIGYHFSFLGTLVPKLYLDKSTVRERGNVPTIVPPLSGVLSPVVPPVTVTMSGVLLPKTDKGGDNDGQFQKFGEVAWELYRKAEGFTHSA